MTKHSSQPRKKCGTATQERMTDVAEISSPSHSAASSMIVSKISSTRMEWINERELTSIYALLAYVSYNQNVRQETVQMIVEAEFGVDNVAKIRREDYMRAIEFLVDIKLDEIIQ